MTLRRLLRKPFVSTPFAKKVDLAGKHAIVTGSSAGSLGYETAKTLARWGALVVVTTRGNTAKTIESLKAELAKEAIQAIIIGHDMDLSDTASVRTFSDWYQANYGERLDILVNNAGIHLDLLSKWKEPKLTADGHEIQWRTNYLGTAQLTHDLLPILLETGDQQGEARVVNVASQIHSRGSNQALFEPDTPYNSWQSYGLSKLAMIHLSNELHRRFNGSNNIRSYSLHPGGKSGAYTNVADKGLEGSAVISFLRKLGAPLEKLFMATAEEGAQTQIYCATAPQARSGGYYQNCGPASASPDSEDTHSASRLWDETLDWHRKLALSK